MSPEDILAKEGEHTDELADLLFAVSPETDSETRRLYFRDEITAASDGGKSQECSEHK